MSAKAIEFRSLVLKLISGFVICVFAVTLISAQGLHAINLDLIPKKKVRSYIVEREISSMENYNSIHASWKEGLDISTYKMQEKVFYLQEKLESVWDCYNSASPVKSWNGHFVRFCLLISKQTNSVKYQDNTDFSEIDTGQVYFLDLKLLAGLFNVPVAFEIIKVDTTSKIIEFSYIDGNKSQGKQTIQFFDNGDGRTRIIHRSYFKSDSAFRDDVFYPFFHTKIIKEFHRNMRKMAQVMIKPESVLAGT
jgi:hypothetical protein